MMGEFLIAVLSHLFWVSVLGLAVYVVGKCYYRPALLHALWLLVLLKFILPPLHHVQIPLPARMFEAELFNAEPLNTEQGKVVTRNLSDGEDGRIAEQGVGFPVLSAQEVVEKPVTNFDSLSNSTVNRPLPTQSAKVSHHVPATYPTIESLPTAGQDLAAGWNLHSRSIVSATSEPESQDDVLSQSPSHSADLAAEPSEIESPSPGHIGFAWDQQTGMMLVLFVWAAGSLLWFTLAMLRLRTFGATIRQAPLGPAWLQQEVGQLAAVLGVRRPPVVRVTTAGISPLVWSTEGSRVILLPSILLERLDRRQVSALLTHELAHLRRGDPYVRWLEVIVLTCYWWFPVAWWVKRQLRQAEEDCCDAWVAWVADVDPKTYASALLQSVEVTSVDQFSIPVLASGLSSAESLQRRLRMILHRQTERGMSGFARLAVVCVGIVLIPLSAQMVGGQEDLSADGPAEESAPEQQPPAGLLNAEPSVDDMESTDPAGGVDVLNDRPSALDATIPTQATQVEDRAQGQQSAASPLAVEPSAVTSPGSGFSTGFAGNRKYQQPSQPLIATARYLRESDEVELRYNQTEEIKDRVALPGQRSNERLRVHVSKVVVRVPVAKVEARVVGEDLPTHEVLRRRLRQGQQVVFAAQGSDIVPLLRENTVVILADAESFAHTSRHQIADWVRIPPNPTASSSQFPGASSSVEFVPGTDEVVVGSARQRVASRLSSRPQPDAEAHADLPQVVPAPSRPVQPTPPSTPALAPHPLTPANPSLPQPYLTPEPTRPEAGPQPILLKMDGEGNVLVLGQKTPLDRLGPILKAMSFLNEEESASYPFSDTVKRDPPVEVVLQLPESVTSSHAVQLIEICRQAGFEKLRLKVR